MQQTNRPKTAVITGAARGIGRETARLLAETGYQVVIGYHTSAAPAQRLAQALQEKGCHARAIQADVSDPAAASRLIRLTEMHFGGVDLLVNNAGIAQQKLFLDITALDWERMFAVNVGGAFHCTQAVLRGMIAQGGGSIVNVSSIWGMVGASCEVHYSAAKAALIGMTKALAKELGPSHIRVNCVAPGVVDTDMNAALDPQTLDALREETPLGTLGSAGDIAQAIAFLGGEQARFITGQVLSPNGGFVI